MSHVRDFGAKGDGKTDDTKAILHALKMGDGTLEFTRGDYRITAPIVVDLREYGRFAMSGAGGAARLVMAGEGAAVVLKGGHTTGSADPNSFEPGTWQRERMPTISQIEIIGAHPKADGVLIDGAMQPTLAGVLIREVNTAVRCYNRCRNVILSHCQIYNNKGVGVHLDHVNLHQTIITGCHISYCRLGGIRIEGSEIRNIQITGNDIEYNNNRAHKVPGADAEPTAEIYIDCSEDKSSVREGTIASNTIQATYSPGGANIRFIGRSPQENHKVGLFTITGNMIGSQNYGLHLSSARGMTITGNVIYSAYTRNILIENSRNIVIGANVFDHNPDYRELELCTGIRLVDSVDCSLHGIVIQDARAGKPTLKDAIPLTRDGVIELVRCKRMNLSGLHVIDGMPYGIALEDCDNTLITGCTVVDGRDEPLMKAAIRWKGQGAGNMIGLCRVGKGDEGGIVADPQVRVSEILDS